MDLQRIQEHYPAFGTLVSDMGELGAAASIYQAYMVAGAIGEINETLKELVKIAKNTSDVQKDIFHQLRMLNQNK